MHRAKWSLQRTPPQLEGVRYSNTLTWPQILNISGVGCPTEAPPQGNAFSGPYLELTGSGHLLEFKPYSVKIWAEYCTSITLLTVLERTVN